MVQDTQQWNTGCLRFFMNKLSQLLVINNIYQQVLYISQRMAFAEPRPAGAWQRGRTELGPVTYTWPLRSIASLR